MLLANWEHFWTPERSQTCNLLNSSEPELVAVLLCQLSPTVAAEWLECVNRVQQIKIYSVLHQRTYIDKIFWTLHLDSLGVLPLSCLSMALSCCWLVVVLTCCCLDLPLSWCCLALPLSCLAMVLGKILCIALFSLKFNLKIWYIYIYN